MFLINKRKYIFSLFPGQGQLGSCPLGDSQTLIKELHDSVHYTDSKTWKGKADMAWRSHRRFCAECGNARALIQKAKPEVL